MNPAAARMRVSAKKRSNVFDRTARWLLVRGVGFDISGAKTLRLTTLLLGDR